MRPMTMDLFKTGGPLKWQLVAGIDKPAQLINCTILIQADRDDYDTIYINTPDVLKNRQDCAISIWISRVLCILNLPLPCQPISSATAIEMVPGYAAIEDYGISSETINNFG